MTVGLLTLELYVAGARSRKDKRAVLRRVKDRLGRFNLAVAEIAYHDLWQRAGLGIVTVGVDQEIVERTLDSALREVERVEPGVVVRSDIEWLA
ncbi:MAG: DUF503 domain-containing protein [Acidobacteriota bacterium]|nr:DUF503 domain-containing protein [Acidobacteriota bacterium]